MARPGRTHPGGESLTRINPARHLPLEAPFEGLPAVKVSRAVPARRIDLPVIAPPPVTRTDGLRRGRLLGWQAHWPSGWSRDVVARGLAWRWNPPRAPALRVSRPHRATPPSILARVQGLLADGVIEPARGPVFLNRLFEVPKKDSDTPRLVLDVSRLNTHITPYKFKMTTVASVRLALRSGCYMASLDLKDAYWHVPIARSFRPFLAFSAGGRNFQFRVMPFGLNIAPRVFSRMLHPVQQALVRAGVQVLMYLDDWMVYASSPEDCVRMVDKTLEIGRSMGLLFNLEKSHLCPTQTLQWLGMEWNSVLGVLSLSVENRSRCVRKLFRTVHASSISLRQWESLLGSLNYAAQVVPLGRLRTRRLIRLGLSHFSRTDRDTLVSPPRRGVRLLRWWLLEDRLSSRAPWVPPAPCMSLTTDASDSGWGYQSSRGHQGAGMWDKAQAQWHINVKELRTVYIALLREPDLRQCVVRVLMDNMTSVHCVNKQGTVRSSSLLRTSELLLEEAHRRGLLLVASYLAGTGNPWADALSRGSTSSIGWSLTPSCFADLQEWAGCPAIDLFASQLDHQLPKFLSRTRRTPSGGPDAFSEDWNRWGFIYLFPPPNTQTMQRVMALLEVFRGRALLVAPRWETQPWFAALVRLRPRSRPLPIDALVQSFPAEFMNSLHLTAWLISGGS